jgi:hypothetical protein
MESNSRLDKIPEDYLFEHFFKEVVYQGVANVTGASSAQAILFHVNFAKNSSSPKKVHESLKSMLGDNGATLVEKSIVRHMFDRIKVNPPAGFSENYFDFLECVGYARMIFDNRFSD